MTRNDPHQDDGPLGFVRNWLMFDENKPSRPQLLRKFIAVIAACFAVTALLAIVNIFTR